MEQFNQYRLFKNGKNLAFEICQKIYKHLGQKSPQIKSINFTEFLFLMSRKIREMDFKILDVISRVLANCVCVSEDIFHSITNGSL